MLTRSLKSLITLISEQFNTPNSSAVTTPADAIASTEYAPLSNISVQSFEVEAKQTKTAAYSYKPFWLQAIKSSKTILPLRLTHQAAEYMFENTLLMRNSYTQQISEKNFKPFEQSHTQYAVPLWTVKLKDTENIPDDYYGSTNSKIMALTTESHDEKQAHLDLFLEKIKSFLLKNVPFGVMFEGKYFDYELLVARPICKDFYLSDHWGYATGGRAVTMFSRDTIVYRATLNKMEMEYILDIINGKFDDKIPELSIASIQASFNQNKDRLQADYPKYFTKTYDLNSNIAHQQNVMNDLRRSIRYTIAQHLCADIIAAKLVMFLNNCGKQFKTHVLNSAQLNHLLQSILTQHKPLLQNISTNAYLHWLAMEDDRTEEQYENSYRSGNKYKLR